MIDVITAVCKFVETFACHPPDIAPYSKEQIIKGWENNTRLPKNTTQFCTVTLQSSIQHGTNAYHYERSIEMPEKVDWTTAQNIEHIVQLDFCGVSPREPPHVTLERANQVRLIAWDFMGPAFFKAQDPRLSLLYTEDVMDMSGFDDTHLLTHRYQLKLHISEVIFRTIPTPSFGGIKLAIREVGEGHVITNINGAY